VPLLTTAEKTAYENGRAIKRGRYLEDPSLSLSYNLPALGALRDKLLPVRYFFFASLRYVQLATNISAEKFSWSSEM